MTSEPTAKKQDRQEFGAGGKGGDAVEQRSPLSLDLRELATAVRNREWTATEVAEVALRRIREIDGGVNAFCTLDDTALAQAEEIDARLAAGTEVGPLAGVPVGVKDLLWTKGLKTTFGSRLYADFVPDRDDVAVERLRAAGAIVIGKTNAAEFGYGGIGRNDLFAPTCNPWNTELSPGGSSAGSAAAVAARMVPLTLGSDGGGSVRIPAALCGIFGMKPSFGLVPVYPGCRDERYPGQSGWEGLEHIGPMTRNAADAALALSVLAGPSQYDRHSLPALGADWSDLDAGRLQGARIAVSTDLGFAVVDPEIRAAVEHAVVRLGSSFEAIEEAHPAVGNTETLLDTLVALDTDRAGLRTMAERQGVELGGWLGSILERTWAGDQFSAALMERKRVVNLTARFMQDFDFLITPSTAAAAFPGDGFGPERIDGKAVAPSAWVPFSALANFTGQPAASVPIGFTSDGRPIGLQVMGRRLDDRGVLALCAVVERLFPRVSWPGPSIGAGTMGDDHRMAGSTNGQD